MTNVRGVRARVAAWGALALAVAAALAGAGRAGAATVPVSTPAQLAAAVASGSPGDEIVLAAGSYAPQATLRVSRDLTISGPAGDLATNARLSGGNITLSDPPTLLVVDPGVRLTVRNLTLTTVASAGAVADVSGTLALEHTTVSGNSGIALLVQGGGALQALNTTISDNAEFGAVVSADAQADLRSTTVAGNTLGGIANDPAATVRLTNSIVANPGAQSTGDCQSPVSTSTTSLSRDASCGANLTGDPLLSPLTNNGGPTSTRALRAGSPALDAGTAGCPASDQRFAARSAAPCDLGAYERDRTAPVLQLPADIAVDAPAGATSVPVSYEVTAQEPDGFLRLNAPLTCTPASGAGFPAGQTTRVDCLAANVDGLETEGSFSVTVRAGGGGGDITPPVVTAPADITTPATSADGAEVTFSASATDAVDGIVPVTCDPPSGSTFPVGATAVDCSASDAAGNTGTASFTVTVTEPGGDDAVPPDVTVPDDITAEATSADGAAVTYDASATDNVGVTAFACVPPSGSTFPVGTTTVDCTADDAAGNTASAAFSVTVEDTTAPELAGVPADITTDATGPDGAAVDYEPPTAADAVDGSPAVTCDPGPGATFPVGTTTVACTATDGAGNTGEATFDVTVRGEGGGDDTMPPEVTVPADLTREATSAAGAAVDFTASASDAVDGTLPATCTPAPGSTFALGATTVTCSATDAAGNTGSATFTVTVVDTTGPVVTVPSPISTPATSPSGAVVDFTASASDAVDGGVPVTCTPASGGTFPVGSTTVTCTATDAAGNTGAAAFGVTVTGSGGGGDGGTFEDRLRALLDRLADPALTPRQRVALVVAFVRTELGLARAGRGERERQGLRRPARGR